MEHGQLIRPSPRSVKYLFVQFCLVHVPMFDALIVRPIVATTDEFTIFVNVDLIAWFLVCCGSPSFGLYVIDAVSCPVAKWR